MLRLEPGEPGLLAFADTFHRVREVRQRLRRIHRCALEQIGRHLMAPGEPTRSVLVDWARVELPVLPCVAFVDERHLRPRGLSTPSLVSHRTDLHQIPHNTTDEAPAQPRDSNGSNGTHALRPSRQAGADTTRCASQQAASTTSRWPSHDVAWRFCDAVASRP